MHFCDAATISPQRSRISCCGPTYQHLVNSAMGSQLPFAAYVTNGNDAEEPATRSSDSIHQSTRCRCLEREGWMEDNSCPITNFPQSSQNTVPGTRDASSDRNARCSRNRSGPSGRGSNWPEISEILRCSTLPSTVNCEAAILSG